MKIPPMYVLPSSGSLCHSRIMTDVVPVVCERCGGIIVGSSSSDLTAQLVDWQPASE